MCSPFRTLLLLSLLVPAAAAADLPVVEVSGTVRADSLVWAGDTVYLLTEDLVVEAGSRLVIEAGAVVKMRANGNAEHNLCIRIDGVLQVLGEAGHEVVFTSGRDDVHGGDTNGDGGATVAAPGDWGYLRTAPKSDLVLAHCLFRYGGLKDDDAGPAVQSADHQLWIRHDGGLYYPPELHDIDIADVHGNGLCLDGGSNVPVVRLQIRRARNGIYLTPINQSPYVADTVIEDVTESAFTGSVSLLASNIRIRRAQHAAVQTENPGFDPYCFFEDSTIEDLTGAAFLGDMQFEFSRSTLRNAPYGLYAENTCCSNITYSRFENITEAAVHQKDGNLEVWDTEFVNVRNGIEYEQTMSGDGVSVDTSFENLSIVGDGSDQGVGVRITVHDRGYRYSGMYNNGHIHIEDFEVAWHIESRSPDIMTPAYPSWDAGFTFLDVAEVMHWDFDLSASELVGYRDTGASLTILNERVDPGFPVSLNDRTLPSVQALPAGGDSLYTAALAPYLRTGRNTVRVLAPAAAADTLRWEHSAWDMTDSSGDPAAPLLVTTTADRGDVVFTVRLAGEPYDAVTLDVLQGGQVLRSGVPQGGTWSTTLGASGIYQYRARAAGGSVLADGSFMIDVDNSAPQILAATATPTAVANDGTGSIALSVSAVDDVAVIAVQVDLAPLGGAGWTDLAPTGDDTYGLAYVVPAGVPAGNHVLGVRAADALTAAATQIPLQVIPSTPLDPDTVYTCGFTLRASSVLETAPGVFALDGNVRLEHDSGLVLALDAAAGLVASLSPPSIASDGAAVLYAELGGLGTLGLLSGEFSFDAAGALDVDYAAQALVDEVAGFVVDPEVMTFELLLGVQPGVRLGTVLTLDAADGVPGNGAPAAAVQVDLRIDGTVSGLLTNASPTAPLAWDLAAGTLWLGSASWTDDRLTVLGAGFDFAPDLFDGGVSVTVPRLVFTPEGIDADSAVVDAFTFSYGGFAFAVDQARFTDDAFRADHAEVLFPLPTGDVYVAVEGIVIGADGVSLDGGAIAVPPLKVGDYTLGSVEAAFAAADGEFFLEAGGDLNIRNFATVAIAFRLDSHCTYLLNEFCMDADLGRGVPIGSTGLLLTDIGGCLADPACSDAWVISFSAGLSSADRIVPPDLSVLSADVSMEITPSPFRVAADGTVDLVGYRLGAAGFELHADRFAGWGGVQMPPVAPLFFADVRTDIRWSPSFALRGAADGLFIVRAEDFFFLDENLELAAFHAEIDEAGLRGTFYVPDPEEYFVAVSARFDWDGEVDFDYDLESPFLMLDTAAGTRMGVACVTRVADSPAVALTDLARRDAWELPAGARAALRDTVEFLSLPAGAGPMNVALRELPAGAGVQLGVTLLAPGGAVVDSTYCAANAGFVRGRTLDAHFFRVASPEPGIWRAVVEGIDEGEQYALSASWENRPPTIALSAPAANRTVPSDGTLSVAWTSDDPDGTVPAVEVLAVPATTPPAGADAGPWTLYASGVDTLQSFTWLPAPLAGGDYRLVVRVDDGFNPVVADTSTAVVTILNDAPPAAVTGLGVRVGPGKVRLAWDPSTAPDLRGYRLRWREQGAPGFHQMDLDRRTGRLLAGLQNGVPYEFTVAAYDVMGHESPAGDPVVAAPDPQGDVDPPAVPAGLAVSGFDPVSRRATLVWDTPADAAAFRVHYDRDVIPPYLGTGAAEGVSPLAQSLSGSITLTDLPAGSRWYVTVSALDAAGNESDTAPPVALLVSDLVDVDQDGLPDDWETLHFGGLDQGPDDDPDDDFLDNAHELNVSGTDPTLADTDGDQILDGVDPNPLSAVDLDHDGQPDDWQTVWGVTDPASDTDGDGLVALHEFGEHTSPTDPDTDEDGLTDGQEKALGTDGWNADTDGGGVLDGYETTHGTDPLNAADDVIVTAVDPGADTPAATGLGVPTPNPFNARLSVPFSLSRSGRATIELYDLRGRVVRTLLDETRDAGHGAVLWNGRDEQGRKAASGVYFVRFRAVGADEIRKVMLVE